MIISDFNAFPSVIFLKCNFAYCNETLNDPRGQGVVPSPSPGRKKYARYLKKQLKAIGWSRFKNTTSAHIKVLNEANQMLFAGLENLSVVQIIDFMFQKIYLLNDKSQTLNMISKK